MPPISCVDGILLTAAETARINFPCTTHKCKKVFHTYQLWQNHEEAGHSHASNMWYCHGEKATGADSPCNRGFSTKEAFISHRKDRHNDPEVDSDDFHIGPDVGKQFYCGFRDAMCVPHDSVHPVEDQKWIVARGFHIGGHLMLGCTMKDWKDPVMESS